MQGTGICAWTYSQCALPLPFYYSGLEETTENMELANFSLW